MTDMLPMGNVARTRGAAAIGGVTSGLIGLGQHVDRIKFSAPCGVVGAAVERILLRPYLRYLITARSRFLVAPRLPEKG
ncbi:hypothetical protein [Arthrobacter sp. B1805]|uniref:hypothetical protein n=1 Tax=Arthrobacter sp. B1805 TaxID=2058892 RepID=UPI0011B0860B|nr:hypothetical protein [Arthrobacter sp. B1805]